MSTPVLSDVPSLIAAHMRAAAARNPGGKAGPFTIGLDEHSSHPMRNFAVPDDGPRPAPPTSPPWSPSSAAMTAFPGLSSSRPARQP
jgi:hypothetical protein